MNKFSSLSTSVLLALLTSSAAAQDYANGTTPQARSEAYISSAPSSKDKNGTEDSNEDLGQDSSAEDGNDAKRLTQDGLDQITSGANKLWEASSLKAKEWSSDLSKAADNAWEAGSLGWEQAKSSVSSAWDSVTHKAKEAGSALEQYVAGDEIKNTEGGVVAQSSSEAVAPITNASSALNATNSEVANEFSLAMERTDYQLDLKQINPELSDPQLPSHLTLSFEHPQELKESFLVAGNDVIIAYGNDDGNFQISFKLHPLTAELYHDLTLAGLKQDVTHRFSDKESMLYGEYEVTDEVSTNGEQGKYLDVSIVASLKKGEDGILPDLQSYFYERNIVTNQYHATLSCELRGRQVQTPILKQNFALLAPLCERVIKSLELNFSH